MWAAQGKISPFPKVGTVSICVWLQESLLLYCLMSRNTPVSVKHRMRTLLWSLSSAQSFSHVRLFVTPWTAAHQASLSVTNSGVYSNSHPLSWWCHPTISSSVIPFSSHLQSFPASGSFPRSQFFPSGGQSIGVLASVNIQDWSPLGWTG